MSLLLDALSFFILQVQAALVKDLNGAFIHILYFLCTVTAIASQIIMVSHAVPLS